MHRRTSCARADSRRDYCYSWYKNGDCGQPSPMLVKKSACCCVAQGSALAAWGSQCTPCPPPGSLEHSRLCPNGTGAGLDGEGGDGAACRGRPLPLGVVTC